ncbi:RNA cap guanine-N2 methyltransferase,S-adenosyl-L-methionine-dependent methyltransferase [Cinara cedri]|uniref:Trimethylguanosine synthase n=1 Tax=Cinara cedri TaxID=506608 RepID=A0A5E4N5R5_9HEMI|nr:RNA cap guanine-N2 methyltransferase,S-adenosyl-L-methionine-dependent methyltransferase [Cinara cedri]
MYWIQRRLLFVRFDAGILPDNRASIRYAPKYWRSILPTGVGFPDGVAVDPFCGAGGNAIQLAKTCKVIAMFIDETKITLVRHNAGVYGCAGNVEFRQNDFFTGPSGQQANVVVTSPPWGGPKYLLEDSYSASVLCEAYGGGEVIGRIAKSMAPKLVLHLPRTVDKSECVAIAKMLCFTRIKFEDNFINGRLNSTTVFFSL